MKDNMRGGEVEFSAYRGHVDTIIWKGGENNITHALVIHVECIMLTGQQMHVVM